MAHPAPSTRALAHITPADALNTQGGKGGARKMLGGL
nr:MAG TPA: hypothetical protein [Caudoviricetes sp.]